MQKNFFSVYKNEPALVAAILILLLINILILGSIASYLFPQYFIYIVLAILIFIFFSQVDFEILRLFSWHLYVFSIFLLILPLVIGQVTRGAIRWIQIGPLVFQPTEIVRPLLLLFFANLFTNTKLSIKSLSFFAILAFVPIALIILQPSLGVAVITLIGITGVFLAADFDKRKAAIALVGVALLSPLSWLFMQDYQKSRILGLINPTQDPWGQGYNRIQSIIAVGSGQANGRGLGEGVQTQLAFLPERHTDFIFASIAEEFGFLGTIIVSLTIIFVIFRLIKILENTRNIAARAFVSGVILSFFVQVFVHMAMNMGIVPITGLPLPLVSAGGSSLIATMATLGIVMKSKRNQNESLLA